MPAEAPSPARVLIAVAAPREAEAVRAAIGSREEAGPGWAVESGDRGFDLIRTGVGKAQAAAAVAWAFDPARHAGVLSIGVGGALPGSGLPLGAAVLATTSRFADEGLDTPEGFRPLESIGFSAGAFGEAGRAPTPAWRDVLRPICDAEGPVATVSTCSGESRRAERVARQTGAVVEAMEGAAIAASLALIPAASPAFAEVRVISNTTGDRASQRWDLDGALERLGRLIAGLDGGALAAAAPGRA
ncbi:MAG: futalosine hydrolase [Phycisphaeraceae bacterium]|nr:MAG: futalosine hydrolase [Phycisphaeraceae bacterium]